MSADTFPGVVEIKAFVPAKDFALSVAFYQDLGFTLASNEDGIAYFFCGESSFLLQDFYVQTHAENFMMHLLVDDALAWWDRVQAQRLTERYAVQTTPPAERPWGMVDFTLTDPTGVLWRIAHNIPRRG
ncbi:VOC family protein [Variovorax boronicumulans]|uniref:VOC family protein n=1 Tax=Variovorax boronicumulans TaxID=436515 RepID=UPI0012E4DC82|nr:VOC family protein [Variovorax boronicumulans]GER17346.1 glyoxalase [Variovorax boronicumulans]